MAAAVICSVSLIISCLRTAHTPHHTLVYHTSMASRPRMPPHSHIYTQTTYKHHATSHICWMGDGMTTNVPKNNSAITIPASSEYHIIMYILWQYSSIIRHYSKYIIMLKQTHCTLQLSSMDMKRSYSHNPRDCRCQQIQAKLEGLRKIVVCICGKPSIWQLNKNEVHKWTLSRASYITNDRIPC